MTTLEELKEKQDEEFIEKGADLEHERWCRWQKHLHSRLTYAEYEKDGKTFAGYLMDAGDYERWSRQIDTFYKDLSEAEKESDRKETRNYLPLLDKVRSKTAEAVARSIVGIEKPKVVREEDETDKMWRCGYNTRVSEEQAKRDEILKSFK